MPRQITYANGSLSRGTKTLYDERNHPPHNTIAAVPKIETTDPPHQHFVDDLAAAPVLGSPCGALGGRSRRFAPLS